MNRRLILSGLLCCGAALSFGDGQPSKTRLDAIWNAVDNRISDQTNIWFEGGDYPKVIHMLHAQAIDQPHDYEVVTNLGWMQENVENWSGALETYKWYKAENPQDRDAILPEAQYLSMRWSATRDPAILRQIPPLLEPTLARKPHPNVWRILAHAYEHLGKLKDAERIWKAYIAWQPSDLPAKRNLAGVEKKLQASKTR